MLRIAAVVAALSLASGDAKTPQQQYDEFLDKMSDADREAFLKSLEASLAKWKADCVRVLALPGLCSCLAEDVPARWDFSRFVNELLDRNAPDSADRRIAIRARDRCAEQSGLRPAAH